MLLTEGSFPMQVHAIYGLNTSVALALEIIVNILESCDGEDNVQTSMFYMW